MSDTFTTAGNPNLFIISINDGVLTGFDYTSQQFAPLDLFISFPGGASAGADWDVITDSDTLTALVGTLSVTERGNNGVPEPPTLAILGVGFAALGLFRTRRRPRLAIHKTTNHA